MSVRSAEAQIRFLQDVQAVLEDGQFVSTYKFALLIALADLAVERGPDPDGRLVLPLAAIADKFIEYYWQQSALFLGAGGAQVLRQSSGLQAAVVAALVEQRAAFATLAALRADPIAYRRLRVQVGRVIRVMPLYKLQVVGGRPREFLYAHALQAEAIVLEPGVAHHLRAFHPLVTGLARERWAAMVRRLPRNRALIGPGQDLERFLFASAREDLAALAGRLADLQHGDCLYCHKALVRGQVHVDHFIPWSLHRLDAPPNLVAAHVRCNLHKRDHLAAEVHLHSWQARNTLRPNLWRRLLPGQPAQPGLDQCRQVARWAYQRAVRLGQCGWLEGRTLVPLPAGIDEALVGRFRPAAEPPAPSDPSVDDEFADPDED